MQIRPEVHLLQGRASNFYLCIEESQLTLIDAGMPKEEKILFNLLEKLNRQPADVKNILITHADIDHAGSLAAIQSVTGAAVYAGAKTAALLKAGRSPQHLPQPIQWFTNTFLKYIPVPESCLQSIEDGQVVPVLDGIYALATPGHTHGHFSFYNPATGVLFAGDALHTRGGRLQRTQKYLTADEEAANGSAVRLLELAPGTVASGHGPPLSDFSNMDVISFFNELRSEK